MIRQLAHRGPENWQVFAVGGLATLLLGLLGPGGVFDALVAAAPVLVFLFALFVFAGALETAGALDYLARWLIARARTPRDLPLILIIGFGLASALLVNDALVLLGVPILLALARRESLHPRPLLLTLAYSVTVGSVLTPLGNPQNLLVSLSAGVASPVGTFLRYLLLPTAVNLVVGGLYLRHVFRRDLPPDPPAGYPPLPLLPGGPWGTRLRQHPVLAIFPATMVVLLASDLVSGLFGVAAWPAYEVAAVGAALVLLIGPYRRPVLRRVDAPILVLFAGLFVVVAGAVAGGVLGAIQVLFPLPGPGAGNAVLVPLAASSLAGPQLVSNVPWVALQIPLLHSLGYGPATPLAWVTLAAASTLAGNVTFLGAASNLIVVDQSERAGVRLRLPDFIRHGLPLTGITVAVLLAFLSVGL